MTYRAADSLSDDDMIPMTKQNGSVAVLLQRFPRLAPFPSDLSLATILTLTSVLFSPTPFRTVFLEGFLVRTRLDWIGRRAGIAVI